MTRVRWLAATLGVSVATAKTSATKSGPGPAALAGPAAVVGDAGRASMLRVVVGGGGLYACFVMAGDLLVR